MLGLIIIIHVNTCTILLQESADASLDQSNDLEVLSVKQKRKRKSTPRSHHMSAAEAMENILQTHHNGAPICHDSSFSEAESPVRPINVEPQTNANSDPCLCELPAEMDDLSVKSEPTSEKNFDPKDIGSGTADAEVKSDDAEIKSDDGDDDSVDSGQSLGDNNDDVLDDNVGGGDSRDVSDAGEISENNEPPSGDGESTKSFSDQEEDEKKDFSPTKQKLAAENIPDKELLTALTDEELLEALMKKETVTECGCQMIFTDPIDFYLHQNVHNRKYPLRCGLCDTITRDSISFMRHLIKRHGCTPKNG